MKNGLLTNKWMKKGLQPNYYWATVDDQIPVELDQVRDERSAAHGWEVHLMGGVGMRGPAGECVGASLRWMGRMSAGVVVHQQSMLVATSILVVSVLELHSSI